MYYIAQYKCRLCNKLTIGKIISEDVLGPGIDVIDFINGSYRLDKEKIPKIICHNTTGHIGIADFVGLEDYESYQLSQLNTEVS